VNALAATGGSSRQGRGGAQWPARIIASGAGAAGVRPGTAVRIGIVGQVEEWKGHHLTCWPPLPGSPRSIPTGGTARLWLRLGHLPEPAQSGRRKTLGLSGHVVWHGFVPDPSADLPANSMSASCPCPPGPTRPCPPWPSRPGSSACPWSPASRGGLPRDHRGWQSPASWSRPAMSSNWRTNWRNSLGTLELRRAAGGGRPQSG
jgi:hypothetical protein